MSAETNFSPLLCRCVDFACDPRVHKRLLTRRSLAKEEGEAARYQSDNAARVGRRTRA